MSDIRQFRHSDFVRFEAEVGYELITALALLRVIRASPAHIGSENDETYEPTVDYTGLSWVRRSARRIRQQVALAHAFGADALEIGP